MNKQLGQATAYVWFHYSILYKLLPHIRVVLTSYISKNEPGKCVYLLV